MDNFPLSNSAPDIPINIDTNILRDVIRRRGFRLLLLGSLVFGAFTIWQLLLSPQTYKGEVSIAIQQSGSALGGLGSLLGNAGPSKKYIGLLRSRALAESVERHANLQGLYHLKTHHEALTTLMDGIKPEDNAADGLLMIRLSLPAPPALAHDPENQREKVRLATADCTNLYAKSLIDYYDTSNTERDNVLLKAAAAEMHLARVDYEEANNHIRAFVSGLDRVSPHVAPTGSASDTGGASQDMMMLYEEQDRVNADIRSAEAVQQTQQRLTAEQLKHLQSLPAEDILLNDARNAQKIADRNLKKRQDIYAPDSPQVKDAKENLLRANEELERQQQGIKELRTTDQVEIEKKLQGLRAKREAIMARISNLEGGLSTKRGLTTRLELLRNEQMIALKRLQEAVVRSVEVRLSAVSGKSMISIVDYALPPLQGAPGRWRTLLLASLLTVFAMLLGTVFEYVNYARRHAYYSHPLTPIPGGQPIP